MDEESAVSIRILLIAGADMMSAGLRLLIESWPGMVVAGEAAGLEDALALASRAPVDVILLDLDLPGKNSLELIPGLKAGVENARLLVLTAGHNSETHRQAVRLGARGVVLKDQAAPLLNKALKKVYEGEFWLDRALANNMLDEVLHVRNVEVQKPDPEAGKVASLSERERQVIALLCEGLSNRELADRLSVSEATVRYHLAHIFHKLQVTDRLTLVLYAFRHDLSQPR